MLFPLPPFLTPFVPVNPLNSTWTLLKEEVQHPASGGVSARPRNPTHTWGSAGERTPVWETELGLPGWIQASPDS